MGVPVVITDLSATAASNSPQGGDSIGTSLDDYLRAISAFVRQLFDTDIIWGGTASGTNTITFTASPAPTAYKTGQGFAWISAGANTAAATANANSLGAKAIQYNGAALTGSELPPAGGIAVAIYDGTQLQLLNRVFLSPPFSDASALIKNSSDATKLALLSASSLTTGTTRTYTFPDKNGTFAMLSDIPSSVVSVKRQQFTASGTYTPSTGMLFCDVLGVGAGAGGGGVSGANMQAPGGGSGAWTWGRFTAAQIGASQTVTIGGKGTGGSSSGGTGNNGGQTSLGALLTAPGGTGAPGSTSGDQPQTGGAGGAKGTGDFACQGNPGGPGGLGITASDGVSGAGGASILGGSAPAAASSGTGTKNNAAANSGSGGSGASTAGGGAGTAGGDGADGAMLIIEYCSQ